MRAALHRLHDGRRECASTPSESEAGAAPECSPYHTKVFTRAPRDCGRRASRRLAPSLQERLASPWSAEPPIQDLPRIGTRKTGSFLVLGHCPDSRSQKRQKTPRENLYKLVDLSPALLVHGQGKDATGAFY